MKDISNNDVNKSEVELKELLEATRLTEASPKLNNTEFEYREGGWGWVVVVATGYCYGILVGLINNYALIYNEFDNVYNQTDNHIVYSAWIGSGSTGAQYVFCSIGSVLTDLFSARVIGVAGGVISTLSLIACAYVKNLKVYFLTYSFLFGLGQALLLASTLAILPHYFNKRLSLANGVMNFVTAVIVVILPIFFSMILEKYSLFETFYFLAFLNLITIFMAFTYKPILITSDKNEKKIQRIKNSFGLEIFKKRKFLIWCIASIVCMFGYLIPVVIIDHHSAKIFPDEKPFYINIVFGAASGLSAIIFGILGDLTKFNRVHYHTIVFVIYGFVQILIPFSTNFYLLLFKLGILGLMDGVYLCFIVPISFDLSESPKLANHAAGYYHVAMTPTIIAGPVIAGKLYEMYHSYDYAFYLGGLTCLIGSLMLLVLIPPVEFSKDEKPKLKNTSFEVNA